MVGRPPRLISPTMPPGLYLFSSESFSPPSVVSKVPMSLPSRITLTCQVSWRVGYAVAAATYFTSLCGGGERPLSPVLDEVENDPLSELARLEEDVRVQLA